MDRTKNFSMKSDDVRIPTCPGYSELDAIQRNVDALRAILLEQQSKLMGAEEHLKRLREKGL